MKTTSTFIRQQLKVKGSTVHTGRGAWWMGNSDGISYDELLERLNSRLPKWKEKGYVESYEEEKTDGKRTVKVVFTDGVFDNNYRTFYSNEVMVNEMGMLGGVEFSSKLLGV
jgi:hypothetical protein